MNTQGKVFKYPDNVDTDVIIPARYLNTPDAKELALHCMEDIDSEFVKNVKKGDMFYVHVLDETLAYQVDRILDMVDKNDAEALQAALALEEGEDYISLFTCTPYGVNSHRLIVRGTRVPYTGEEHVEVTAPEAMVQSIQNYYMIYLILGLAVTLLVIVIMKFAINRRYRREKRD